MTTRPNPVRHPMSGTDFDTIFPTTPDPTTDPGGDPDLDPDPEVDPPTGGDDPWVPHGSGDEEQEPPRPGSEVHSDRRDEPEHGEDDAVDDVEEAADHAAPADRWSPAVVVGEAPFEALAPVRDTGLEARRALGFDGTDVSPRAAARPAGERAVRGRARSFRDGLDAESLLDAVSRRAVPTPGIVRGRVTLDLPRELLDAFEAFSTTHKVPRTAVVARLLADLLATDEEGRR